MKFLYVPILTHNFTNFCVQILYVLLTGILIPLFWTVLVVISCISTLFGYIGNFDFAFYQRSVRVHFICVLSRFQFIIHKTAKMVKFFGSPVKFHFCRLQEFHFRATNCLTSLLPLPLPQWRVSDSPDWMNSVINN